MSDKQAGSAAFKGLRGIFWPIHKFELKKFLPMGFMMMCILFNYNILRDTKDTLVVNAPGAGAECLSYLKLYGVTPSAILFMIIFMKLANVLSKERLFYTIIIPFITFFGLFGFVIYPNTHLFHMSLETIQSYQAAIPRLHWFIPVIGNWSYSIFYILSELWGSVVLSMLFWQFANEITKVEEAKRFYGLFGFIGNIGLLIAGPTIMYFAMYAKSLSYLNIDTFAVNMKFLMGAVATAGIAIIFTYRWMTKNVLTDPKLYQAGQQGAKKKEKLRLSIMESFRYIIKNPYLALIAVLVLSYGISINLVEGVWKGQIKIAKPDKNDYNMFMGQFTFWSGFATMIFMIIGNNILRKLSWAKAAIMTPVMLLVTSSIFFLVVWNGNKTSPFSSFMGMTITVVMAAVIIGMIQNVLSKATKYSLFDSTKQMAYIPLDPEAKVKGQAAVEVIGGRAGKSGGALIQSTLLSAVGGSVSLASLTPVLGPLVIVTCVAWLFSVLALNKRFTALVEQRKVEEAEAKASEASTAKEKAASPVNVASSKVSS